MGPKNKIYIEGFEGVEVFGILPFAFFKGAYLQRIRNEDLTVFESETENDLSIALEIQYKGQKVTLAGDATRENWLKLSRARRGQENNRRSVAAKLPHHGSKRDSGIDALQEMFDLQRKDNVALISANGVSHPDLEILELLSGNEILPYCTNLHPYCGNNLSNLVVAQVVDPETVKFLNRFTLGAQQPCQGNLEFTIHDDGTTSISREFDAVCGFRGDYDFALN